MVALVERADCRAALCRIARRHAAHSVCRRVDCLDRGLPHGPYHRVDENARRTGQEGRGDE